MIQSDPHAAQVDEKRRPLTQSPRDAWGAGRSGAFSGLHPSHGFNFWVSQRGEFVWETVVEQVAGSLIRASKKARAHCLERELAEPSSSGSDPDRHGACASPCVPLPCASFTWHSQERRLLVSEAHFTHNTVCYK